MKTVLYLHIGASKTGSSAIQALLHKNSKKLLEMGILYPNSRIVNEYDQVANHYYFFNSFFKLSEYEKRKLGEETIDYLCSYASKKQIKSIILSQEGLTSENYFVKLLKEKNVFIIKIIIYVRRQDEWIESGWKQWGSKTSTCNTIEDWIRIMQKPECCSNWYNYIRSWENITERKNIIVRVYEKSQLVNGDLLQDFCKHVNIPHLSELELPDDISVLESNRGFNRDIVEITHLSRHLLENAHDNSLFEFYEKYLGDSYMKKPFEKYNFLSNKRKIEILEYFEESNRKTAQRYLGRKNGRLFLSPCTDPNETSSIYEGLSVEKIVPFFMEIVFTQSRQIASLNQKLNDIVRTVESVKNANQKKIKRVFTLSKKDGNDFSRLNDINKIIKKRYKLIIESTGNDPHFDVVVPFESDKTYRIEVTLVSPESTDFEIFFTRVNRKHLLYFEEDSRRARVKKSLNHITFIVLGPYLDRRLRVDPGTSAGKYVIRSLKIYEVEIDF